MDQSVALVTEYSYHGSKRKLVYSAFCCVCCYKRLRTYHMTANGALWTVNRAVALAGGSWIEHVWCSETSCGKLDVHIISCHKKKLQKMNGRADKPYVFPDKNVLWKMHRSLHSACLGNSRFGNSFYSRSVTFLLHHTPFTSRNMQTLLCSSTFLAQRQNNPKNQLDKKQTELERSVCVLVHVLAQRLCVLVHVMAQNWVYVLVPVLARQDIPLLKLDRNGSEAHQLGVGTVSVLPATSKRSTCRFWMFCIALYI